MTQGFDIQPPPVADERAGSFRGARLVAMAAVLSSGVVLWLHALRAAGLTGLNSWAGTLPHVFRNSLLAFPLAFAAVTFGTWLARRSKITARSVPGSVAEAALIAILFALLLAAAAGLHKIVDRAIDSGIHAHAFHGQSRAAGVDEASGILNGALQGVQNTLLEYIAALPLISLSLLVLPRGNRDRRIGAEIIRRRTWAAPDRLVMTTALALMGLGVGVAGLGFTSGKGLHHEQQAGWGHAPIVYDVTVGVGVDADEIRVTVQSAKWVRQARAIASISTARSDSDAAGDPDRVYLEVTVENLGALRRSIGRAEFRMLAQDGNGWAPLADDFPAMVLAPGEKLSTRLVFEIPPRAAHLEFLSTAGGAETHIPISDDDLAGLFAALCRALAKSWNE